MHTRKRWTWDPLPFVVFQFFGGLVLFCVSMITDPCDSAGRCGLSSDRIGWEALVGLSLWIGPWLLAGLVFALKCLWQARPRRVEEEMKLPDLRVARKRSDT
jgi:hypothetical protein